MFCKLRMGQMQLATALKMVNVYRVLIGLALRKRLDLLSHTIRMRCVNLCLAHFNLSMFGNTLLGRDIQRQIHNCGCSWARGMMPEAFAR